jgi:hypothetical protein
MPLYDLLGNAQPAPQQPSYMTNGVTTPSITPTQAPFPFGSGNSYESELQSSLDYFMNPNSQLMQQAAQRGMEVAATRGGVNSSIAAGASQRAAMEQAVPLAQSAAAVRVGERQALIQDWAAQQGFNRELAAMPFTSSMNMLQQVTQYSLQDPQLYTPGVISGYTNFFNQQMNDMMQRYFGGQ